MTESFLPSTNGVTTSVLRVLDHLERRGHDALIVCPGPAPSSYAGFPVVECASTSVKGFRTAVPNAHLNRALEDYCPDVLHAASPFVLGAQALYKAKSMGIPSVAIFQTDVAGFARRNKLTVTSNAAWRWLAVIHNNADLNLAPSSQTLQDLRTWGIERTAYWGRGVDTELFDPRHRTTAAGMELRSRLTPGKVVVGYVGRLAPEKSVDKLIPLAHDPRIQLVIVGDGPSRPDLTAALAGTDAMLLGKLSGDDLATAYACLDVFVHTGNNETFGQTLQEAMASGVPVVAPASGGPIDIVDHGITGLLFHPDRQESLEKSVKSLVASASDRQNMGQAGLAKVLPRSWEAVCDQLIQYYECVMSQPKQASLRESFSSGLSLRAGSSPLNLLG